MVRPARKTGGKPRRRATVLSRRNRSIQVCERWHRTHDWHSCSRSRAHQSRVTSTAGGTSRSCGSTTSSRERSARSVGSSWPRKASPSGGPSNERSREWRPRAAVTRSSARCCWWCRWSGPPPGPSRSRPEPPRTSSPTRASRTPRVSTARSITSTSSSTNRPPTSSRWTFGAVPTPSPRSRNAN